jgi:Holliday junction resolvase RusA-like endonuclease
MTNRVAFTILGEPASKANSRKIAILGSKNAIAADGSTFRTAGRAAVIKSEKALSYARDFRKQVPPRARLMLKGPIRVTMTIFYASERPDLDESLILDLMQPVYKKVRDERVLIDSGVYLNDRQVVERHVFRRIDRANPRAEIEVEAIDAQAQELPLSTPQDEEPFGVNLTERATP